MFWHFKSCGKFFHGHSFETEPLLYSPEEGKRKEGSTPPWNVELVKRTRPQLYSKRWPASPLGAAAAAAVAGQPSFILCRFYGPAVPRSRHFSTLHKLLPWRHCSCSETNLNAHRVRRGFTSIELKTLHLFERVSVIYRTVSCTDCRDSKGYWESMSLTPYCSATTDTIVPSVQQWGITPKWADRIKYDGKDKYRITFCRLSIVFTDSR